MSHASRQEICSCLLSSYSLLFLKFMLFKLCSSIQIANIEGLREEIDHLLTSQTVVEMIEPFKKPTWNSWLFIMITFAKNT